jgi:hypothetical protein
MPEDNGPWYKNDPPGYSEMDDADVILLGRKPGPDTRQSTRNYTEFVLEKVEEWDDWEGYIAPEAHAADKGAGDQWVWDVENPGKFLEAVYDVDPSDLNKVRELYDIHRGQGWQFPIIFVFESEPSYAVRQFLEGTRRTPYVDLSTYHDVEGPTGTNVKARLRRLEAKLDWLASLTVLLAMEEEAENA